MPVCFKTADRTENCQLLTPDQSSLPVPTTDLFFADATGKGYYRSAYPPALYANLVTHVEDRLNPSERIRLIGDEWAQFRANKATVGDYLNLVTAVKADPSSEVVSAALSGVDTIYDRVAATGEEKQGLSAWIRSTFAPQLAKLGDPSPSDSPDKQELRAHLFAVLGYYGKDPAVLQQARVIAEKYLADRTSVEPTLGQTALGIAARNGDAALFDELQHVYETSTDPQIGESALFLLARFQDPSLLERAMNYAASSKVRNQDAAGVFATALGSRETRDAGWKYIQNNWDKVNAQLTTWAGAYIVGATSSFCSAESRDDVQKFFTDHKVAAVSETLKHSVERINGCIELRKLQEPNLDQWLATQSKS